jgi:hypothetical protein
MRLAVISLSLVAAAAAMASPPAAIRPDAQNRAQAAFEQFAADWMTKVRALEAHNRANPQVQSGASEPVVTYRGYAEGYALELRPTGHAKAPWVGLLRYTELLYSCRSVAADDCSVASTVPVTEIFRYTNGRWAY